MLFVATVHSIPAVRRAPVELWGTCNEPGVGINGPLPCIDGAQCICKDASKLIYPPSSQLTSAYSGMKAFSQCREPINGVWSDNPSWQCQKPGDMPASPNAAASNVSDISAISSPSSGALPTPQSSSLSTTADPQPADSTAMKSGKSSQTGSMDSGQNTMTMYSNASATVGGCSGLAVPDGWDGVASTTVRLHHLIHGQLVGAKDRPSIMDIWAVRACVALAILGKHLGKPILASHLVLAKVYTQVPSTRNCSTGP